MKKSILFICSFLMIGATLSAQQQTIVNDALSFSKSYYFLTSRSAAMGGAAGTLKADLGAISINPAAIATYETNEIGVTPEYFNIQTKSDYLGYINSDKQDGGNLRNAGIVYTIQPKNSAFRYNIGFVYNRLNLYNTYNIIQGTSDINGSYWNEMANNLNTTSVDPHFKEWADANTIPPSSNNALFRMDNGNYIPNVSGQVLQMEDLSTAGRREEYALSFGINITENLYLGISGVIQHAKMLTVSALSEADALSANPHYKYETRTDVSGTGFGGKIGAFYLLNPEFTIGLSIHSPIFFSLTQHDEERIFVKSSGGSDFIRDPVKTTYNLMTPLQATLSFGYEFPRYGSINFDCEMSPYAMTNLSNSSGHNMDTYNDIIGDEAKFSSTFRLGGEYFVLRGLALRLGLGYSTAMSSSEKSAFNIGGGIGYNFGETSISLAYVRLDNKRDYTLYETSALVKTTMNSHFVTASLTYRF
jgi:hypothetical protein